MDSKPFPTVQEIQAVPSNPTPTPMELARRLFGKDKHKLMTLFEYPVHPNVLNNKTFPVSYIAIVRRELGLPPAPKRPPQKT